MPIELQIVSLISGLVGTILGVISFVRTKRTQDYDYSPRIQIENENFGLGSPTKIFVDYTSDITNRGLKPLQLERVWMKFGSSLESKSGRIELSREQILAPGELCHVDFERKGEDLIKLLSEGNSVDCVFSLEVEYRNLLGRVETISRNLGGYLNTGGDLGFRFFTKGATLRNR